MRTGALTAFFILYGMMVAYSQNTIGIPDVINYTKDVYNAGTQNRAAVQDRNGVLYFANYEGLLSFDGNRWTLYPLPNKSVVRSLALGKDDRIYAGGQDEFGYFSPDSRGRLSFTSLKEAIPPGRHPFSDVWNIVPYGDDIFFRSNDGIFRLSHRRIIVYPTATSWQFLGLSHGQLIAQDERNGLLQFRDGGWVPFIRPNALPAGSLITSIFPMGGDSSFLTTINTGFYILNKDAITPFHWKSPNPFGNERILTAIPVNKDWIAVGTNLDGCYIIDRQGRVIQDLSRKEGLQNNNILSLFLDKDDNLWLGLDNGIDFIAYNNAIKHIYPEKLNEGLGYTSLIYDHTLYVGTSNGLYQVPVNDKKGAGNADPDEDALVKEATREEDLSLVNGEFRSVPGTKGSTWGLAEINDRLLLAHHDGAFQIDKGIPIPVSGHSGRADYWNFLPLSPTLAGDWAIAGNDNGIDLLHLGKKGIVSKGNLPGFGISSQFVAIDDAHSIWVAHPYQGIFKITGGVYSPPTSHSQPAPLRRGPLQRGHSQPGRPPASLSTARYSPAIPSPLPGPLLVKHYTEKDGLPPTLKNRLFKIRDRIVVASENGVYEYDPKTDHFAPSGFFKPFFGQRNIRYLKEDAAGNIWFIENRDLGVIDFSGPRPETIYFPELNGKMVSDFEHVYPYDASNIFVGAEKGFYHIDYRQYRKNRYTMQVGIRSVKTAGKTDSLLWGGYNISPNASASTSSNVSPNVSPGAIPRIDHSRNSLRFEFSAPLYAALNSVEYSYRLKGFDKDWSEWSKKAEKEYTNLSAGSYSFEVRAKSNRGNESPVDSYSFTILPPLWQSGAAYSAYALLVLGLAWLVYKRQTRLLLRQRLKYEEEQKKLQYLHDLELEKSEKEIVKLNNEKLEAEIGHKNRELASAAMHLVQKGELLANIREELVRLKKHTEAGPGSNGSGPVEELKKILRALNEENKTDKDWEQFALHFDQVHSHFLRSLRQRYPALSPHELKLCAYLRMNLSSKQIARLESISVRGVEIGRYRLRKKLKIPTETNLFDFLMAIEGLSQK